MSFVISAVSSKGGCGKTTLITLLADQFSRNYGDRHIGIVDADPNQHSVAWGGMPGRPANINIYPVNLGASEDVMEIIDGAARTCDFVLVDVEGTASMTMALAIASSDMVIIPCQASRADAAEAIKTLKNITNQEKTAKRSIFHAVLFNRTSPAIVTRNYKYIRNKFIENNVTLFDTHLDDREAFRAVQTYGGSIYDLTSEVGGIFKAKKNIESLAHEVLTILKGVQVKEAAGV